jgi:hypothetical protein
MTVTKPEGSVGMMDGHDLKMMEMFAAHSMREMELDPPSIDSYVRLKKILTEKKDGENVVSMHTSDIFDHIKNEMATGDISMDDGVALSQFWTVILLTMHVETAITEIDTEKGERAPLPYEGVEYR